MRAARVSFCSKYTRVVRLPPAALDLDCTVHKNYVFLDTVSEATIFDAKMNVSKIAMINRAFGSRMIKIRPRKSIV